MRNMVRFVRAAVLGLFAAGLACSALPQEVGSRPLLLDRKPGDGPQLLVLGTAHWANPGKDMVNVAVDDMLAPGRQAQIEVLLEQLAAFRPTLIALEWPQNLQGRLDATYADYRAGKLTLNASEHQQIGYRLAAKLNLPRIHAVDWNLAPPGEESAYDFPEWAAKHGQTASFQALFARVEADSVRLAANESVPHWLLRMNEPAALLANHRSYFDVAGFGDAESQPGAAWVGTWYARNLRIFTNLTRLPATKQDRILVIYGAGHAFLLRQFAQESNAFRLVNVGQVLVR